MVPGDSRYLSLMVRAGSNEAAVLARVRQIIWDLDPNMPILEAKTMTEMFGDSIARPRFLASLSGAFTICAVLIAAVGVYGVSAYWVARRRRELAIRLAVGASPDRLILIVIARSLRLAAIGTIAGLAGRNRRRPRHDGAAVRDGSARSGDLCRHHRAARRHRDPRVRWSRRSKHRASIR